MNAEVFNVCLGAVVGALLGSLGTVAVFGGRLVRIETKQEAHAEKVTLAQEKAEKASSDANKAWTAFREMTGYNSGRTGEVPKFTRRDSGEGPSSG